MNDIDGIESYKRAARTVVIEQGVLFDLPDDWRVEWWGMPEFVMGDARPEQRITVNFACWDDVLEFGTRLGITGLTSRTDSVWFPRQDIDRPNSWCYDDES